MKEVIGVKINGIGTVKKEEILNVLTNEGREALKNGEITLEEAGQLYKLELVKKHSKVGGYGDTFNANFERIPDSLKDKLSPEELGELVDAFYECCNGRK